MIEFKFGRKCMYERIEVTSTPLKCSFCSVVSNFGGRMIKQNKIYSIKVDNTQSLKGSSILRSCFQEVDCA